MREVTDSLIAYERNRQFRIGKEYLVTTLRDAVRLANIRYGGGVSSYLEMLDTETRLFDAELTRVTASLNERVAVVQLYKALGGGWQPAGKGMTPEDFRAANRKADGKLTLEEFLNARFRHFDLADTNGDGVLTLEEVEVYVNRLR